MIPFFGYDQWMMLTATRVKLEPGLYELNAQSWRYQAVNPLPNLPPHWSRPLDPDRVEFKV